MADKKGKKADPKDDITAGNDFIAKQMEKRGIVPGKAPRTQLAAQVKNKNKK